MGTVKSRPLPQTDSLSDENISGAGSSTLTTKPITRSQGPRHEIFPQSLYHTRQPSIRSRHHQPPIPPINELDTRFAKVLVSWIYLYYNNMHNFGLQLTLRNIFRLVNSWSWSTDLSYKEESSGRWFGKRFHFRVSKILVYIRELIAQWVRFQSFTLRELIA